MNASIRSADISDIPQMVDLLVAEAERRRSVDPVIWTVSKNAKDAVGNAVRTGLENAKTDSWQVAEVSGQLVGICHGMMLPIPPIYAGALGLPGLILDDFFVTQSAPDNAAEHLLASMETALRFAGADVIVASSAAKAPSLGVLEQHAYQALTLFMGKTLPVDQNGSDARSRPPCVKPTTPDDVPGIVKASARNRLTLKELHPFWTPHIEADTRFDRWMRLSLTFHDRDMFVTGSKMDVNGYVIVQPIARLLVPAAHDITSIGVLDDFYDAGFADIQTFTEQHSTASDLLSSAEFCFARRHFESAMVVCPASWQSKKELLKQHGYRTAKQWMLKN